MNIFMIVNVIVSLNEIELFMVDTTTNLIDYDNEYLVLNICKEDTRKWR